MEPTKNRTQLSNEFVERLQSITPPNRRMTLVDVVLEHGPAIWARRDEHVSWLDIAQTIYAVFGIKTTANTLATTMSRKSPRKMSGLAQHVTKPARLPPSEKGRADPQRSGRSSAGATRNGMQISPKDSSAEEAGEAPALQGIAGAAPDNPASSVVDTNAQTGPFSQPHEEYSGATGPSIVKRPA